MTNTSAPTATELPTTDDELWQRAVAVLKANDLGGWTKAAPALYPHQWSWDSAFIAIGLARISVARAADELSSLLRAQWRTGMIPHIVFNPEVGAGVYFPDADRWGCAELTPDACEGIHTSGLCQPPVHAIATLRIVRQAERNGDAAVGAAIAREFYPGLFAWHRYLHTARDPEQSGLVTIYHPWESGMDNSPRWDAAMEAVEVGPDLLTYERADLAHVADASQRPTKAEYDRYLWLVELLRRARYGDEAVHRDYPFLIKDVYFSAILVAADEALLELATMVDADGADRRTLEAWIVAGREGLARQWDADLGLCLDYDVRTETSVSVQTVAGFAPLIADGLDDTMRDALLVTWRSERFCGHPELRWPVPPSTSPVQDGFQPRSYWRGPTWPFNNWLLWWSLQRIGAAPEATALRSAGIDQIRTVGFAEYIEPFTGEPLGSPDQSWTAAVLLDWLAEPDETPVGAR